jgi:hypothetical protein
VIHPEIASEKFLTSKIITFKIYVRIFFHCLLHSALANKTPDLIKKLRIFNEGNASSSNSVPRTNIIRYYVNINDFLSWRGFHISDLGGE